jgi:hypothetical protein
MSTDNELLQKQKELNDTITKGIENTIPAYFFNLIGNALSKIFRLTKRPHWVVNAFVLGVLIFLPGFLVAILTGEIYLWGELHLYYVGISLVAYFAPIVSHLNLTYNVLPGIRDHIVDSIQDMEDLNIFSEWLSSFWSVRKWMIINICIGIPYLIVIMIAESLSVGKFIGFGILTMLLILMPIADSFLYVFYKILTFPPLLAGLKLNLYESDPVNSEVIQRLSNILNIYLYYVAGYIAIVAALFALRPNIWFIWINILLGWLPTTAQFLVNQYAVRRIIISAKWRNLNRIQEQIKDLQNVNLKEVSEATIARINQMMDLHDRIGAKPNSMLNWGTGLSFLNQLMLPLLGLLLGNIDKWLKLLNP